MARKNSPPPAEPVQDAPVVETPATEVVAETPVETTEQTVSRPLIDLIAGRSGTSFDDELTDDDVYSQIVANSMAADRVIELERQLQQVQQRLASPPPSAVVPAVAAPPAPAANTSAPQYNPNWQFEPRDADGNIANPEVRQQVAAYQNYQREILPQIISGWGNIPKTVEEIVAKQIEAFEKRFTGTMTQTTAEQQFQDYVYSAPGLLQTDANGNLLYVNNAPVFTHQGQRVNQYRQSLLTSGVAPDVANRLTMEAAGLNAPAKPAVNFRAPARNAATQAAPVTPTTRVPQVAVNQPVVSEGTTWNALINQTKQKMGIPLQ